MKRTNLLLAACSAFAAMTAIASEPTAKIEVSATTPHEFTGLWGDLNNVKVGMTMDEVLNQMPNWRPTTLEYSTDVADVTVVQLKKKTVVPVEAYVMLRGDRVIKVGSTLNQLMS